MDKETLEKNFQRRLAKEKAFLKIQSGTWLSRISRRPLDELVLRKMLLPYIFGVGKGRRRLTIFKIYLADERTPATPGAFFQLVEEMTSQIDSSPDEPFSIFVDFMLSKKYNIETIKEDLTPGNKG